MFSSTNSNDDGKGWHGKRRCKGRFWFILVCVCLFFATIVFLVCNEIFAFVKFKNDIKIIEIPKNSSATSIAKELKRCDVIGSVFLFSNYVKLNKIKLKYGTFEVNSAMSYDKLVKTLTDDSKNGKVIAQLNFYEGSNMFSLQKKYELDGSFDFASVVRALNDKNIYSKFEFYKLLDDEQIASAFFPMEGFCATSSFNVKKDYDAETVAKLVFKHFDETIEPFLDDIKDSPFSLWEIITLASIIQAETSNVKDMSNISSVLHNRLKNRTYKRLECDATRVYSRNIASFNKNFGIFDNKMVESYDTYKCFGLPSGPVCNPGCDSIRAALHPARTEYLYFCVDIKTKKAYFAKTFEEHKINLKKAHLI